MVYTLSSPTVLASDAACQPRAVELLDTLSGVFRLTDRGVTHLGLHALDLDAPTVATAWESVVAADAAGLSTVDELTRVASDGPEHGVTLALSRLGTVADVVRLVVTEAHPWPDPATVDVPGCGRLPASAAAAAGAVAQEWVGPAAPARAAQTLAGPWRHMHGHAGVVVETTGAHGPRGAGVQQLCESIRRRALTLDDLASVEWETGEWSGAMHVAAWAAHTADLLREQMVAVLDVTAEVVRSAPGAAPHQLRHGLLAAQALAVAAVVDDLVDPLAAGVLRRAA
ncbi:hypothetical protein J4G33_00945 [Actinotalea sp. BY-33]|uniref:Uncharacterized protein n=1 Tax=Actinotalea soli TaxID=2819234 RepID=A0A939LQQ7_9CELL|nr:hypothetical protein [Actinotalea soli]MBO1750364.1 hypothetical protein [Actinotalea soli]